MSSAWIAVRSGFVVSCVTLPLFYCYLFNTDAALREFRAMESEVEHSADCTLGGECGADHRVGSAAWVRQAFAETVDVLQLEPLFEPRGLMPAPPEDSQ